MNRQILVVALFAAATAALAAQQASQTGPYEGVSNPPPDDTIVTSTAPQPKPRAAHYAQPAAPKTESTPQYVPAPAPSAAPVATASKPVPGYRDGTDGGIVQVAEPVESFAKPTLAARPAAPDPDGDIVHPNLAGPNELAEGTQVRVRLMQDLSSALTQQGEAFRARVSADVMKGDRILLPVGSVVEGRVVEASMGGFAGHGTLMLQPDKVTLPNGAAYPLRATVISTPMSNTKMGAEGEINPGSRRKKNEIEYGGAMGAGAVTGAYLGGPVGALAGTLVGAGVVTTHLLVSHPQTHLSEGDVLILMLTQNLSLGPENARRN